MALFVGALAPAIWLQPGEEGTTKPSVFGPARELYPYRELRLDPMRTFFGVGHDGERRGSRLERVQLLPDETEPRGSVHPPTRQVCVITPRAAVYVREWRSSARALSFSSSYPLRCPRPEAIDAGAPSGRRPRRSAARHAR